MRSGWFLCLLTKMDPWAVSVWCILPIAKGVDRIASLLGGAPGADCNVVRQEVADALSRLEAAGLIEAAEDDGAYRRRIWNFSTFQHAVLDRLVALLACADDKFLSVREMASGPHIHEEEDMEEQLAVVRSALAILAKRRALPFGLRVEVQESADDITAARVVWPLAS